MLLYKKLLLMTFGTTLVLAYFLSATGKVSNSSQRVATPCFCIEYRYNCKNSKFNFPLLTYAHHTAGDDVRFYCVFKQRE